MPTESRYRTDWKARLEDVRNTASQIGIDIEDHDLANSDFPAKSGLCRIRGRSLILLDRSLPEEQQVEFLVQCLKQFDLESIFIPAWLRERLEFNSTTS